METSSFYYNIVAGLVPVPTRAKRGMCGTLTLEGTWDGHNWLSKKDKPGMPTDPQGRPLVYREWQVLCALQDSGLVPVVDTSSSPEDEEVMFIACINNAATIGDYTSAYLEGLIPIEVLKDILSITAEVVEGFHSLGWAHGDLHANNVVIGHNREGWKAYIIDVATATKDGKIPSWLAREFILSGEPEDDITRLCEDLSALGEGCSDPQRVEALNLLLGRLF